MQEKLQHINRWQGKYSPLIENETITILWFPLVEISFDRWIGLSNKGDWITQGFDDKVSIISQDNLVPFLPCLEHDKSMFMSSLSEGLKEYNIERESNEIFPTKNLIVCGLISGSDYWATLAVKWLEDLYIDDELKELLKKLLSSKWASQKLRHKVQKLLKRN